MKNEGFTPPIYVYIYIWVTTTKNEGFTWVPMVHGCYGNFHHHSTIEPRWVELNRKCTLDANDKGIVTDRCVIFPPQKMVMVISEGSVTWMCFSNMALISAKLSCWVNNFTKWIENMLFFCWLKVFFCGVDRIGWKDSKKTIVPRYDMEIAGEQWPKPWFLCCIDTVRIIL